MADMENEALESAEQTEGELSLIDRIVKEGKMAKDQSQETYAKSLLGELARQILDEGMIVEKGLISTITDRIAQLDVLISNQLNEIMHHPQFQEMESSWRGLQYFVKNSEVSESLQLRLLNVSKQELLVDLEKAMEFDQSALFKKVYEAEYGSLGGTPYSALIGDFYFGRIAPDMNLLRKISEVAAAAHAPFISAAAPGLFDMESFIQLNDPIDLAKIFQSAELAKWRSFRETEDSRYVVLTLPRMMLREPYGPNTRPVEGFNFFEDVDGSDHNKYLWGNAAYGLGTRITQAFSKYKWCAAIRGVEGGGLITDLPVHNFETPQGDIELKCPSEIPITDRREKELNDLGFIALIHCKGTDRAAFFGGQTTNKPKVYDKDVANECSTFIYVALSLGFLSFCSLS
jgi:type VI secretion system protein ImpC